MKSKNKKLLAVAVAASLIVASSSASENKAPACLPEDPLLALESEQQKSKGKRKNRKGYFY